MLPHAQFSDRHWTHPQLLEYQASSLAIKLHFSCYLILRGLRLASNSSSCCLCSWVGSTGTHFLTPHNPVALERCKHEDSEFKVILSYIEDSSLARAPGDCLQTKQTAIKQQSSKEWLHYHWGVIYCPCISSLGLHTVIQVVVESWPCFLLPSIDLTCL